MKQFQMEHAKKQTHKNSKCKNKENRHTNRNIKKYWNIHINKCQTGKVQSGAKHQYQKETSSKN